MGYFARFGFGVGLLVSAHGAQAEPAPQGAAQWTAPAPPSASKPAPAPSAGAQPSVAPSPQKPAPAAEPSVPPSAAAPEPSTLPAPPPPPPGPSAAQPGVPAPPPYGAPYPGYAPPPPGYEYAYYYPPPPPRPKLRYPSNSAVSSTPFFDGILAGAKLENRFSEFLNIGAQAGMFVQGRLRLSARIAFPTDTVRDDSGLDAFGSRSKSYSFLWGGSAGIVAVSSSNFVLSPGIAFARSDVSDYGSMLALSLPFEWVLGSGVRVGMEFNLGRAFGGRYAVDCQLNGTCPSGSRDRPAGTAFWMQFQFGFGLNHPAPLPPQQPPPPPPPAPPRR